jgi:hypothetical protein
MNSKNLTETENTVRLGNKEYEANPATWTTTPQDLGIFEHLPRQLWTRQRADFVSDRTWSYRASLKNKYVRTWLKPLQAGEITQYQYLILQRKKLPGS